MIVEPCRVEGCPVDEEHQAHPDGPPPVERRPKPEGANAFVWAISDAAYPLCPSCLGWKVTTSGKTCTTCEGAGRVPAAKLSEEDALVP